MVLVKVCEAVNVFAVVVLEMPFKCDPSPKKAEAEIDDAVTMVLDDPLILIDPGVNLYTIEAEPPLTIKLDPPTEKAEP